MMKSDTDLLEREINKLLTNIIKKEDMYVLNELRLNPCEMDVIALEPNSFTLISFEIKKNKWRDLLFQAIRAKLYCHYSYAVMPKSKEKNIPIKDFIENGIGIVLYSVKKDELDFMFLTQPSLSDRINRNLKKRLYWEFYNKYGDLI